MTRKRRIYTDLKNNYTTRLGGVRKLCLGAPPSLAAMSPLAAKDGGAPNCHIDRYG